MPHALTSGGAYVCAACSDHRPRLWFKVTDRGIGMAAEDLPRVVEPFQQADNTITRRYGGSGLGLSISCDLVALLGGDLVYASADGEGSIFVITIPCVMAVTPTTRTASFAGGMALGIAPAEGQNLSRTPWGMEPAAGATEIP